MKKTLFTSLLALCCASVAMASDYTTTVATNTDTGGYYGIYFELSDEYTSSSITNSTAAAEAFAEATQVSLDSIEFTLKSTQGYVSYDTLINSEIALYCDGEYITSGTVSSYDITVLAMDSMDDLGVITTTYTYTYKSITYSFDDTVIDLDEEYTISFTTDTGSAARLEIGMTQDNVTTDNWGGLNASGSDPSTNYAPTVTISTSYVAVPEPATATLSLVALAGLMVRRRRQA